MPTKPPTKKVSPGRVTAALGLAAAITLTLLAATPAAAAVVDGSADVEVQIVEREGFEQGVHALVFLRSRYFLPMDGDVTLTVNGIIRKVEPVATDSRLIIDIPLGPMQAPITACATFGGLVWLGGDSYRPTQDTGCDHIPLTAPPGFRAPTPARPGLVGRQLTLRR